jgi:hypothetical protein
MIGGSANKVVVPTLTRSYVLYAREDRKHIAENIIKKHFNHPNSDITLWHGTTRDHWPQVRGVKGMVSILSAEMDRQANGFASNLS